MTRRRMTVLALGAAVLGVAPFARAQSSVEPHVVVPQMRVIAPPSTTPIIRLERVAADISFGTDIATTTVKLQLSNPTGSMQEAVVVMPIPADATIRSFRLEGLGDEGVAKLLPREDARKIYDDIVRSMRDPGLLEFEGYGAIRSSVFPVPANGTQTAEIVYEQILGFDAGRRDFELPRTGILGSGGAPEWSITLRFKDKLDEALLFSPTHELKRSDQCAQCWSVVDSAAPGPFIASILPQAPADGLGASLVAYPDPDGDGGYFMFVAAPPKPDAATLKREVTIVIDRSGSMRGDKLEQAREAALQIVAGLEMGERFNIIDYSDTVEAFADAPVVKSRDSAERASAYLEAITPGGGTNIHDALLEAVRSPTQRGFLPMVLFLTDGLPTIGPRSEIEIRDAVAKHNENKRRIFTFGVGFDVNAPLLAEVASSSRGASTFVRPNEDVEVKVGQVFRRLEGPVLAEPEISFDARGRVGAPPIWDTTPSALPDLFDGDRVTVFGRYRYATPIDVTLTGRVGDEPARYTVTFAFDNASMRHSYVARMWASRKIASMVSEIRRASADGSGTESMQELVDEIVRLSLKFGILTEYTAFLAVEPEFAERVLSAEDAMEAVGERLDRRAPARVGRGAVNQEMNMARQSAAPASEVGRNRFLDADMNEVEVQSVQQIASGAAFNRRGRWVQAELLEVEDEEPDETVEFGSDRYFELARTLAGQGRQGMIAVRGDVLLDVNGRRVLVRGPRS